MLTQRLEFILQSLYFYKPVLLSQQCVQQNMELGKEFESNNKQVWKTLLIPALHTHKTVVSKFNSVF